MSLKSYSILIGIVVFIALLGACKNIDQQNNLPSDDKEKYQNKGEELVMEMIEKTGDMNDLYNKKDVIYTYTYETPDGKKDISTEKYMFDGELSYGEYEKHERTMPELKGTIEQGYDGSEYWLRNNNKILTDSILLKRVAFNRPTNYYWFTMFQKLADPGLKYEYIGDKVIDDNSYDVVKISFESKNDKPTDIYQLYINQETSLVDQFLFTVADFGILETPNLMVLSYEKIDGLYIPTQRLYKKSTWDADVDDNPWIKVNWTNIKFNNGLNKEHFEK